MVEAKADVEQEIAGRDRILHIERVLVDVGGGMKVEQLPAAGQVEG